MAHKLVNSPTLQSSFPKGVLQEGSQPAPTRSCRDCYRRKVRCNKVFPCDNCVRLGYECSFPPAGRRVRKTRRVVPSKSELISRLTFLEQKVESLSAGNETSVVCTDREAREGSPEHSNVADFDITTSPTIQSQGEATEESAEVHTRPDRSHANCNTLDRRSGRLVVDPKKGATRYVNDPVLTDLEAQIEELRNLFDSHLSPTLSSEEETPSSTSTIAHPDTSGSFLLGYSSVACSLRSYHPSPTTCHILLNVFEENIAPMVPIVHKPTLRNLIETACVDPGGLDRSSETLVFAVYFAAVSSLAPDQCAFQLGEAHPILVERYRFAIEQALARANFLHTHKLIVLQSAVLFLTCARQAKDDQFVWTMIAVVTRLSIGLGLHRDGSNFGLTPFETELRRRLWWYINLLDSQSSDYQATSPLIREGDSDTRMPLNINDKDLSATLTDPPQERIGFTEMTLFLVRCEILTYHRQLMQMEIPQVNGPSTLFKNRERALNEARRVLDERYVQFCNVHIPIQWVTATIARVAVGRLWLISHFALVTAEKFDPSLWPERWDTLLLTAIEVLEFVYLLETNENTAKWSWLFEGYVQWHSLAFVLSELCVHPTSPLSDRAWLVVSRVQERWRNLSCPKAGMIMRPLQCLMNRVAEIRSQRLNISASLPLVGPQLTEVHVPDSLIVESSNLAGDFPLALSAANTTSLEIFREVLNNSGLAPT